MVIESDCRCVSPPDWHSHPRQEKEGRAEQRVGCHEESGCQKRLICSLIKLNVRLKKNLSVCVSLFRQ